MNGDDKLDNDCDGTVDEETYDGIGMFVCLFVYLSVGPFVIMH